MAGRKKRGTVTTRLNRKELLKARMNREISLELRMEAIRMNGLYDPISDTYINPQMLPEVEVTAEAPKRTWTSEWTYNDPDFKLRLEHINIAANDVANSVREKLDKTGKTIGAGALLGGSLITGGYPAWWTLGLSYFGTQMGNAYTQMLSDHRYKTWGQRLADKTANPNRQELYEMTNPGGVLGAIGGTYLANPAQFSANLAQFGNTIKYTGNAIKQGTQLGMNFAKEAPTNLKLLKSAIEYNKPKTARDLQNTLRLIKTESDIAKPYLKKLPIDKKFGKFWRASFDQRFRNDVENFGLDALIKANEEGNYPLTFLERRAFIKKVSDLHDEAKLFNLDQWKAVKPELKAKMHLEDFIDTIGPFPLDPYTAAARQYFKTRLTPLALNEQEKAMLHWIDPRQAMNRRIDMYDGSLYTLPTHTRFISRAGFKPEMDLGSFNPEGSLRGVSGRSLIKYYDKDGTLNTAGEPLITYKMRSDPEYSLMTYLGDPYITHAEKYSVPFHEFRHWILEFTPLKNRPILKLEKEPYWIGPYKSEDPYMWPTSDNPFRWKWRSFGNNRKWYSAPLEFDAELTGYRGAFNHLFLNDDPKLPFRDSPNKVSIGYNIMEKWGKSDNGRFNSLFDEYDRTGDESFIRGIWSGNEETDFLINSVINLGVYKKQGGLLNYLNYLK